MENIKHFEVLNNINVNDKIEKKDKLTYLSWAWAWSETKKRYPNARYGIEKNENKMPYFYDDLTGYVVYTWVEIENIKHEMWLPVMDSKNKTMFKNSYKYKTKYGEKTVEKATMFDINKTLMRCLTKNLAMFGLGLYIYNGEDLPESENKDYVNKLWKQIKVNKQKSKDIIKALYEKYKGDYSEALKSLGIFNINSFDEIDNSIEIDNLYNTLIKIKKSDKKEQVKKPETKETKQETKQETKKPEVKKEENLNTKDIEELEILAKSKISNYNHIELIDFVLVKLKEKNQTSTNLNSIPRKYLSVIKNMITMYKTKKEQATLKAKENNSKNKKPDKKEPETKKQINKNNPPDMKDRPETKDF
jgi:hypothetical protein